MDPEGYIGTMFDKWEASINTTELHTIENRFGCCGFNRFLQFEGDECNWSIIPCQQTIATKISEPTKSIGRTIMFHSIIHALISVFFGYAGKKKKKKHNYDAGEWNNEIAERYNMESGIR